MRPEALKDWGEPFRLAASRVSRTLCLESALVGAGPALYLVASYLCFFVKSNVCGGVLGVQSGVECFLLFNGVWADHGVVP